MTASTSLYRKYRSPSFEELVGQEPVVRTLKNAIAGGRISHAYLFTGPRGVGKTSAARLLAKAANCLSEGADKPCNQCPNCIAVSRDIATDLIEIDAASNTGVDNIREVIERAQFAPSVWNTKFYIIDEVHMLSVSAFNALLKTLEEPPPHTTFILATTEIHKVPATVASRCQRFDFRRIPLSAMLGRLEYICAQEGIEAEKSALELVARQATGALRDALSLLDQLRVYAEGAISLKAVQELLGASGTEGVADFVDSLLAGDVSSGLTQINSIVEEGLDTRQFNRQVVEHLRNLLLVKSGAHAEGSLLDVTEGMATRLKQQAGAATLPGLLRWVGIFAQVDAALRSTAYRQLPLEMALVEATLPAEHAATLLQEPASGASRSLDQAAAQPRQRPHALQNPSVPPSVSPIPTHSAPPPQYTNGTSASSNGTLDSSANGHKPHEADRDNNLSVVTPDTPVASSADSTIQERVDNASTGSSSPKYTQGGGPPADGSDELVRLRSLWPHVVDHVKAKSPPMAGVFGNGELTRPLSVVGKVVTLGFRDPVHVQRSRMEKQRALIEEALGWVLGYPCRVESVTFADADAGHKDPDSIVDGDAPTPIKERPSPYETTRGKAAMNIFGITKFED
ncbi:MAG: DNA polymerase III subunit gamma/tau [Chloroflexota bacterium]|nr:DNA polymerase III subunit gamma/tau [Chloroflexota bacterium]